MTPEDESRGDEMELNVNQVDGLKVALGNLDGRNPITLRLALGNRVVVDCPESGQRWEIGPNWKRKHRA